MYLFENYSRLPVSFVKGEGPYLYDDKGKRYLDFISGIGVTVLGHSHPALTKAICDQAQKLIHVSNLYENPWQEELAQKLVSHFGSEGKVFFCNSGAEANETAIKLVRKYFRMKGEDRYRIIVLENAFHGRTYGSLSATPRKAFHEGFGPMLDGFDVAQPNTSSVESKITNETAAVMLEVIQGEGGVKVMDPSFLADLGQLLKERGILLIVDEVQTGVGRTGRFFASHHWSLDPDVITLAKGLGGGVPIGCVIAKEEIAKAMVPGSHGSTFGGNALACKAGLVVIEEVEKLLDRVREIGDYFKERLREISAGEVRGMGLMVGVETGRECGELVVKALENGLLINCTQKTVLRFLPPLIVRKDHVDECIDVLKRIL